MQKNREMAIAGESNFGIPEQNGLHPELGNKNLFVVKNKETGVWENLKAGDENALGELYNIYIDTLFAYGLNFSQDRGYVMDCIHDLFVDLHKYRKSLSTTDNIKYYLFKSLKRKINKKYHRKIIPVSMDYQFSVNAKLKNYTCSHEEDIINGERVSEKSIKLSNALNTLTKKQRKGLFLRFNQQRTYEEIAEIMGVSVQTARTTIYRALKTLR
ncbi:MAG: sigma-70 family RNA polymerase sigma factor [Flavobacteriaceae bacterium]